MKTKKNIFAIVVVISISLITFNSCSIPNDNETTVLQPNDSEATVLQPSEDFYYSSVPLTLIMSSSGDTNFKDELIEQINTSKTISRGDENYLLYSEHRISDVTEFYFPNLQIDGFELFSVEITESVFSFYYSQMNSPNRDLDEYGNYIFCNGPGIQISIIRMDATDIPASTTIEQLAENFRGTIRDGLVYVENANLIAGLLGETWFHMQMTDISKNFETLRDISNDLVETAELVTVR